MEEYESVLLVKTEVFVFNIPPRTSNRAYRAADWNLNEPSWTGRLKLVTKGNSCVLKLEDKNTGKLFAQCPIDAYPGVAIESVTDSSRYFVIKVVNDDGRSAFIGLGFADRSDSFDFNVALQDHFKWTKKEKELSEEVNKPGLDLRFKEGETIKINMKITKKDGSESSVKSKPKVLGTGILPPPPGSNKTSPASDKPHCSLEQSSTNKNETEIGKTTTPFSNWVQF